MKILAKNWQLILRLLLILVAIAMVIVGLFRLHGYYQDEGVKKTAIVATIVKNKSDSDEQLLHYNFEDKEYTQAPRDKFLHNYGKVGEQITVYIQSSKPDRVFIQKTAKGEETVGLIFLGWGLLLFLIAWLEGRVQGILKRAEKFEIQ